MELTQLSICGQTALSSLHKYMPSTYVPTLIYSDAYDMPCRMVVMYRHRLVEYIVLLPSYLQSTSYVCKNFVGCIEIYY